MKRITITVEATGDDLTPDQVDRALKLARAGVKSKRVFMRREASVRLASEPGFRIGVAMDWQKSKAPSGYLWGWDAETWERVFAKLDLPFDPSAMYDTTRFREFADARRAWEMGGGSPDGQC